MRIPLLTVLLLAGAAEAWALNPPAGWTSTGDHTAVRDPRNPENGEIREFMIGGATGDLDELEIVLRGSGLVPSSIQLRESGSVELVFPQQVGRARFRADSETPAWLVLFMSSEASRSMDADAILLSMLPLPTGIGSGQEVPTPLDAGFDGDPWGTSSTVKVEESSWLTDLQEVDSWTQESALVGSWEGVSSLRGESTRILLRLEADGVMVLESRTAKAVKVYEGGWSSLNGVMHMDLGDAGVSRTPFEIQGATLELRFDGLDFDLVATK